MRSLFVSFLFAFTLCSSASGQFVHPGVAHSSESIAFVKEQVAAGKAPWLGAWKRLSSSGHASLDWKPTPFAVVKRGPYNNPDVGSSEFSADGRAAYYHALCWTITGNEAHAMKAEEILNAWSGELKSIEEHDAALLVGMSGYHYCVGAELLKHTWDKWPQEKQSQFESMLRKIFYPTIKNFYPTANGNWDASMMQAMIAMAVFLDDQKMFKQATNYYLQGRGNGAIGNYFKPSGQCQESGRDQAHTQMGLEFLANTCETAWIQDVDLYGALDNRLLKGFEYTAKYNLGFDVPYEPYKSVEGRYNYKRISDDSRGSLRPMYERIHNHYANRKDIETPYTKQAALELRSDASNTDDRRGKRRRRRFSPALDTLMYAGVPAAVVSSGDQPLDSKNE
ncbi:alginate lyase family protein [Mariniblastus fucicola]|uniref:Alginate lyase n=1 Tax=Mariniblastus fucicola TaxID=980251 RepID=A0A5B9PF37_9BACT|nr:alginate lyase family protein [Mariniblastus fucicola]QEG24874.1 Alginate lyase [Mariniblastus fucicola]